MDLQDTLIKVHQRLAHYGFGDLPDDDENLGFTAKKVLKAILIDIHWKKLPEDLYEVFIDMVCGEYLYQLYCEGKLESYFPEDVDITSVGSVKVGDITVGVTGAGTSPRKRFEDILDDIRHGTRYRYLFDFVRRYIGSD